MSIATPSRWFTHHINRRAPRGGEVDPFTGAFRRGGEFETFFVPRAVMPQVDEKDFPALFAFARERGVQVVERTYDPAAILKPHQHVDKLRLKHIAVQEDVLAKPIFVSLDEFILDGNHRWMEHVILGKAIHTHQFRLPFEEAIGFLFDFPATYSYGDGKFHPESA